MLNIEKAKPVHNFSSNTFVLSSCGEFAVVDPSVPFSEELCSGKLKYILLTHSHFDHILDIDSWVKAGGEVIISDREKDFLSDPEKNCYALFFGQQKGYSGKSRGVSEDDVLTLGDEEIEILEVPGHTVGSLIYKIGDICFVGDTVFAGGGYGRFDLPSGNVSELRNSIDRVLSFPDKFVFYPGHGDSTTAKEFKEDFLR